MLREMGRLLDQRGILSREMETNTDQNGNSETKKQYMKRKKIGSFNTRLDTIEEKISEPKD